MPEGVGYGPQNTASIGLNLNIIGNFAYAYSGVIVSIDDGYVEMLKFTTGNYVFVGKLTMVGATVDNNPDSGMRSNFKTKLNNTVTMNINTLTGQSGEGAPGQAIAPMIIPPYTEVIVSNRGASSGYHVQVSMAGRVYGKIE